jgi:RNA 2',3'-cyclic 3'-phosphodiesterase
MTDTSRLFFALWPDDETRLKLAQLNRSIDANGFKPLSPHNFHVTLVFVGNVSKASESVIKQRAADIESEPFVITFDHVSYWAKPKVLCLTNQHPVKPLMRLSEALNSAVTSCGIQTDPKPYNPHITLARHGYSFIERDCDPIVWQADSFCLVESCSGIDGVCYNFIDQWPFVKK